VFLIPFELLGLAMLWALALTILEPWRWTSWKFGREQVVRQTLWPFYRRTRSWIIPRLDRLELRRQNPNDRRHQRLSGAIADPTGHASFTLAFVSSDNIDVCDIGNLTEGEARWMARIILERCPDWFGESPGIRGL
jgi:hypothetical protein